MLKGVSWKLVLTTLLLFVLTNAFAVKNSAVGYWLTWNHQTKQPSSVIKIWGDKGLYFGKVYKIVADKKANIISRCSKCEGKQYNKPILGLTIIRDMRLDDGVYRDGFILDPLEGKEYHAKMEVTDDNKFLRLRGYVGIPLFGRTETWSRASLAQVRRLKSAKLS